MSKKLVIKDVKFGKVPYGYANGASSLAVYFDEEDGDYTYEAPDVKDKTFVKEEIVAHGLMTDLINLLKERQLEQKWSEVLLARNWVYFVGSCIVSPENRVYSAPFFELIDKVSLEVQKKVITERVGLPIDDEKTKAELMRKLSSPLTSLVTEPKYFTGKDDFYQRFRTVLCKYPLEDDATFNQMACVEIGNHNFSSVILDIKDFGKEKDVIESRYLDINAITVSDDRVYLIDHTGNKEVAEYALDKGYRLNRALDYEGVTLTF